MRDKRNRLFLVTLGVSAFLLLAIHSLWGTGWDGGGSFLRFLTALFPFFLVGAAEFIRRFRRVGVTVLTLCAAFSIWIALVEFNGYYNESPRDGLVQVIGTFHGLTGPRVELFPHAPALQQHRELWARLG